MNASRGARFALTSAVLWLVACETPDNVTSPPSPTADTLPSVELAVANLGDPLPNLTADQLARFTAGEAEFEAVEEVSDGLGPVFNEAAYATCHNLPVGGTTGRKETRFEGRASAEPSIR